MSLRDAQRDRTGLAVLSVGECLRRLATEYTGRLAVNDAAGLPTILPVNYRLDAQHRVVLRTSTGTKLDAARRRTAAAFEVDRLDEAYQSGWSVLVRGTIEVVTADLETADLRELALRPWARAVERDHWLRIVPTEITGREVVHG